MKSWILKIRQKLKSREDIKSFTNAKGKTWNELENRVYSAFADSEKTQLINIATAEIFQVCFHATAGSLILLEKKYCTYVNSQVKRGHLISGD